MGCAARPLRRPADQPLDRLPREGADTNQAEKLFSRLRRAEIGQHHRIGVHLHAYAGEMAWREDNRRKPNGTLFMNAAGAAAGHPVSRQWAGYWQR